MPTSLDDLPYELRRGDSDSATGGGRLYGGRRRADAGRFWVAALQRALAELGFDLHASGPAWVGAVLDPPAGPLSASFDRETEWAVREFQVVAHMWAPTVGFSPGPISGVLDARTAECIRRWTPDTVPLQRKCPVTVAGFGKAKIQPERRDATATPEPGQGNLWRADQLQTSTRTFAKDDSGFFPPIPGRVYSDYNVLGAVSTFDGRYGPLTNELHSWTGPNDPSEVLPARLFPTGTTLTASRLATFRVVRAISESESPGGFEGSNAYDSQLISVGLMHWTISPWGGKANHLYIPIPPAGELPAFWGYFAGRHPEVFRTYFGSLGLRTGKRWRPIGGASTGRALYSWRERKYLTTAASSTAVDGLSELFPLVDPKPNWLDISGDAAYLRTWHLIHRLAMTARAVPEYQQAMGEFARIRVRDLMLTPWPAAGSLWPPGGTPPTRNGAPATIGDTFRSERCLAMVVRWHVKSPADVVSKGVAGRQLREVYTNIRTAAPFSGNDDTDTWTEAHERVFAEALLVRFPAVVTSGPNPDYSMPRVSGWRGAGAGFRVREVLRTGVPAALALAADFTITQAADAAAYGELTANPPAPPAAPELTITAASPVHARFTSNLALGTIAASLTLRWAERRTAAPAGWVRWEVEEVDESNLAGPRHRLFELRRANGNTTTINVTEAPILRLVRDFAFDATGLPPPDVLDEPHEWVKDGAVAALAGELTAASAATPTPLPPARKTELDGILRKLAPHTDFKLPDAPAVVVEENAAGAAIRWRVEVAGNEQFRSVTIRRSASRITVDPPGFSCRYKTGADRGADLRKLGFPAPASATDFTEQVREFQVAARRPVVAKEKAGPAATWRERLEAYTLTAEEQARYRYSGPTSGEMTNETAGLIDHWLSEQARWRSPVVFEVMKKDAVGAWAVVPGLDNVWSLAEADGDDRTVWVTDLGVTAAPQPLAAYEKVPVDVKGWRSQNVVGFTPCSAAAELTTARVRGADPSGTATYEIFRAVMNRVCGGHLDGVDARFGSDVFLFGGTSLNGQFGAVVALARDTDRAAAALLESEGWQAECAWQPDASARRGRLPVWNMLSSQPNCGLCPESDPLLFDKPMPPAKLQTLRNWHWYYRLVRAGRHEPEVPAADPGTPVRRHGYARALWGYMLTLLRLLTRVPIPGDPGVTLGRIVTTQRGWAVLLYWYLRRPAGLVTPLSDATPELRAVVKTARDGAPATEAEFQGALITGLSNLSAGGPHDSVFKADVAALAGLLSDTPNSWNGSQLDAI